MQDIKDRIMHLMKTKNINATQLAEIMSIQRSGISHILSGRNKPGTDFIIKLKESFPEFSLDWLLMGKGPATLSQAVVAAGNNPSQATSKQPSLFDFTTTRQNADEATTVKKEQQAVEKPPTVVASKLEPHEQQAQEPEQTKKENPPLKAGDEKKIVKLIFVYDDNTFRAINPAD